MQAQLVHDPARGAGYGVIDIHNAAGRETELLFSLRRASDGKYLGSGDWLEAEQRLSPDMVQYRGDSLRLLIGPAVVDMVDVLNTFAITIYPAGGEGSRCGLEIGDLVYSGLTGGQGLAQSESAPLHLSPMPEMRLDPAPVPTPAPEAEPAPTPAPAPDPPLPALKDPVERTNRTPLILLLLLVCAAGGAYWWWHARANAPASDVPAPLASGPSASAPADPASVPDGAPQLRAPAAPPPPLQRAREALRTGITPEQAVELAKSLPGAAGADGAFLLLEDAAQKGSPEAMLGLARFYDPADAAPKGSILPDPAQAHVWYSRAKDRGQGAAAEKLTALRAWAEAEKDRNPQAKRLLEGWK